MFFLERLHDEIEGVDLDAVGAIMEPRREVEEDEKVIGVLPPYLKKFFIALVHLEHDLGGSYDKRKRKLVDEFFRMHLEEAFPELLRYKGLIDYRKGWKVVTVKTFMEAIFDFLKHPFSGGYGHG